MNRSTLARRAAIAAACLGSTAAIGATPALAATGTAIWASGSSLQTVAQNGSASTTINPWTGLIKNWNGSGATGGSITYTPTGSGQGLAVFGNAASSKCPGSGAGVLDPGPTCDLGAPASTLDGLVGSDDPPTSAQETAAQTASGSAELTDPVFQAPVGILLSLPNKLKLSSFQSVDISNALLQDIYNNAVPASKDYGANTWGALLEDAGLTKAKLGDTGGGTSPITIQVRAGGSGTTYTAQGFLSESGDAGYSGYTDNEALWPTASNVTDGTTSGTYGHGEPVVSESTTGNNTGGNLVLNTVNNPGSIGYANYADTVFTATTPGASTVDASKTTPQTGPAGNQYLLAEIQNNEGAAKPTYASPGTTSVSRTGVVDASANVYTGASINTTGTYSLTQTDGVGDWAFSAPSNFGGTLPADPDVSGHAKGATRDYGIVAGTYDIAWENYETSTLKSVYTINGATETTVGNTVKAYLSYVSSTGARKLTSARVGYAALPSAIASHSKTIVGLITP